MKKLSKFSTTNIVRFNAEWKTEPKNYVGWIESIKVTRNKTFQYFIRDAYNMLWCIPEQCIELIGEPPKINLKCRLSYFELKNDELKCDLDLIIRNS